MDSYPIDSEKIYFSSDYLSLECEGEQKTLKIGEWLLVDPVRGHGAAGFQTPPGGL